MNSHGKESFLCLIYSYVSKALRLSGLRIGDKDSVLDGDEGREQLAYLLDRHARHGAAERGLDELDAETRAEFVTAGQRRDVDRGRALPPRAHQPGSVGFAIIGLGDYALKQIMPRFAQSKRAHIAALVSGNPAKLREVGEAYGVPQQARYSYDSFAAIAANPAVEAVYIVLPTGLHAEWAIRAFAAGKHVMCEKPPAISSQEARQMRRAAEKHQSPLPARGQD